LAPGKNNALARATEKRTSSFSEPCMHAGGYCKFDTSSHPPVIALTHPLFSLAHGGADLHRGSRGSEIRPGGHCLSSLPRGRTCLSGPRFQHGSSSGFRRARQACPSGILGDTSRRDLLVRSAVKHLIIHFYHRARQACPSEKISEGSARRVPLSEAPVRQVRHSPFDHPLPSRRGLKSRVESGAKAPHSMECGDSSPLFGEGFSLHNLRACGCFAEITKTIPG